MFLKSDTEELFVMSEGKVFQSVGAATEKDLAPYVFKLNEQSQENFLMMSGAHQLKLDWSWMFVPVFLSLTWRTGTKAWRSHFAFLWNISVICPQIWDNNFSNSLIIHKVNCKLQLVYHITCVCLDTQWKTGWKSLTHRGTVSGFGMSQYPTVKAWQKICVTLDSHQIWTVKWTHHYPITGHFSALFVISPPRERFVKLAN